MKTADELIKNNEYLKALQILENQFQLQPDNIEILRNLVIA